MPIHHEDIARVFDEIADRLEIQGVEEILRTGSCQALQRLERELPPHLTDLLRLPGLGPKRVCMPCTTSRLYRPR